MPAVTVIFPDELLARIDARVAERKAQSSEPQKLTAAQTQQAHVIAEKEGVAAANRYLKSLRQNDRRPSRMGLVLELVEHGLLALDVDEAKNKGGREAGRRQEERVTWFTQ